MKKSNPKNNPKIFIVEDDPFYQNILLNEVKSHTHTKIQIYNNGEECLKNMDKNPDIVLLDYNLESKLNGIEVLKKIKASHPNTEVIMLSSQEKMDVATNSMKFGAFDYVTKSRVALKRVEFLIEKIGTINSMIEEKAVYQKTKKAIAIGAGVLIVAILILRFLAPQFFSFQQF